MRKKILLISPYFPYPPYDGGKVRMFNLIKKLSRLNDLYLLSYVDSPAAQEYIPALEEFCQGVYTVQREESKAITAPDLPRSISFFYTPEMIQAIEWVVSEIRPDVVQIDFLIMTQYVHHVSGIPVVYTEHDISNINFEQSIHDRDLDEKSRFVEWTRLVAYERRILPKFSAVIVLTERDQRLLREFLPGVRSTIIPTGTDIEFYRPGIPDATSKDLLFVGHYRHYPNFDAAQYFVQDIFPKIREREPRARFIAAGSGPTPAMSAWQSDNIAVTGTVADVSRLLAQARVFVAPVRLGGGVKGKILEALACGVPVVATVEAGEGIRCTPGEHLLVARDEKDFAEKTLELLNDRARHEALALAGRKLVEEHYDWNRIVLSLDAFYGSLL